MYHIVQTQIDIFYHLFKKLTILPGNKLRQMTGLS